MGRSRDQGNERYATVTESAEALGITAQAIYNRIKAKTIPYEDDIDPNTKRHSYRIPRDWLEQEVARRSSHKAATGAELVYEGESRTAEVITAFIEHAEAIRAEIATQNTEFLPLEKDQLKNQTRILGEIAGMKTGLDEFFKLARTLNAKLNERERIEREFQQSNLELGRELRDLSRRNLALFEKMQADAQAMKAQREERGQAERRSLWRRIFGD